MQRFPARGEAPMHIYVIHENAAWLEPLARALDAEKVPWRDWFLDQGMFDLSKPPPAGVFYNRMSASSHTRDHRYAAELTAAVLAWLAGHGRRVVNGPRALDLEISKSRQYAALEAAGIHTPRTVLVAGRQNLVAAARRHFDGGPVILKPNRGGKGLGVRLFHTAEALALYLDGPEYEAPVDGLHLLQQYVRSTQPLITRAEFVGGRFLYAVEVDTSEGFELCPADVCAVDYALFPAGSRQPGTPRAKFTVIELAAQPADLHVDRAVERSGFAVAREIEEPVAREDLVGVVDEGRKEIEFAGCEAHLLAGGRGQLAARQIKVPSREPGMRPGGLVRLARARLNPPQDAFDPRQQLPEMKRLWQIIGGPHLEAHDPVD